MSDGLSRANQAGYKEKEVNNIEEIERCIFCNWRKDITIPRRVFYEKKNYFAFLDAPFHTKGHTILAFNNKHPELFPCADNFAYLFSDLSSTLFYIIEGLKRYYNCKDITISCLRGVVKHLHFHLVPIYESELNIWKKEYNIDNDGQLMAYLGYLETKRVERSKLYSNETIERIIITEKLQEEVADLKKIFKNI